MTDAPDVLKRKCCNIPRPFADVLEHAVSPRLHGPSSIMRGRGDVVPSYMPWAKF